MPRSELRKGEPIPVGMDKEFQRAYATTPNVVLAARYGVSVVTILKWARQVGLRKDPEYRRGVQRRNASKRRLTLEQREHLSQRARGRRVSPETIAKALETKRRRGTILSGSRHPFWKGGRPWARFRDPAYVRWRNAVLTRDEYRCQRCGRQCRKHTTRGGAQRVSPEASALVS